MDLNDVVSHKIVFIGRAPYFWFLNLTIQFQYEETLKGVAPICNIGRPELLGSGSKHNQIPAFG